MDYRRADSGRTTRTPIRRILKEIQEAIEERLPAQGGKAFAVFDFDNTCIINDVGDAAFNYLCDRELLRDTTFLGEGKENGIEYHERVFLTYHALVKNGRLKAAYMLCAKMFSGFTPHEAEAITLAAITAEGVRLGSKMLYGIHIERGLAARRSILSLVEYLRGKGVKIWIISATPEPAVRAAMKHFGVEGELIGMRNRIENGVYTSELEEPFSMFEGKVECIKKFIDAKTPPLLATGDSMNDLPMLEEAHVKVVIKERELAALASDRGWFVL